MVCYAEHSGETVKDGDISSNKVLELIFLVSKNPNGQWPFKVWYKLYYTPATNFCMKVTQIHYNIPPLHKWEVQDVGVSFCSNLLVQVAKALFEWLITTTVHDSVLLWWWVLNRK